MLKNIFSYVTPTFILLQKPGKETYLNISKSTDQNCGFRTSSEHDFVTGWVAPNISRILMPLKHCELHSYLHRVTWEKTWNFSTPSVTTYSLSILWTVFVLLMSLNVVQTSCAELQPTSLGASGCTVLMVNVMLTKFPIIFQFIIIQISRILHSKSWVWLSLESLLFPTHNFWVEILNYYNVVIHWGGM